jgi:hypothetical protein
MGIDAAKSATQDDFQRKQAMLQHMQALKPGEPKEKKPK